MLAQDPAGRRWAIISSVKASEITITKAVQLDFHHNTSLHSRTTHLMIGMLDPQVPVTGTQTMCDFLHNLMNLYINKEDIKCLMYF